MSAPTPTALPPLQGRYRIEGRLGASRLAVVYRAFDDRLQRQVLVHLLRRELADKPALVERFRQEAQFNGMRSHRSLLDIFDVGDLAGRPYLISEYVSGRPLRDLGTLSLEDALLYFRQVVGAVAACQEAGVPHPPISSNNVIVVDDGHVELLESWLIPNEDVPRDLACYRPPERTAGAQLSSAGAVYSLGLMLVELIIGRRLVEGDDPAMVARAHLTLRIPSITQLQPTIYAPALDNLIQRATARDPIQRIPSAAALAHALDQLRQEMAGDTIRFQVVQQAPSVGEQVRRSTGQLLRPVAAYAPLPRQIRAAVDEAESAPISTESSSGRTIGGLAIIGILFLVVACGAYFLASLAFEQLADIHLPRPDISNINIGISLPEWMTGVAEGQGEVLEVAIHDTDGLNLRDSPSLKSNIITLLPNGTHVRRVDGPKVADGLPWLKVRATINGRDVEGWVSASYVKPV